MVKINTSFWKETDDALAVDAQHIVDSMTDNTAFATPTPTLEEVQTALTTYTTTLALAVDGGTIAIANKNAAKTALEQLLSNLGVYVQFTALGDDQALMSSGFPLRKTPVPVGKLAVGETVIAVSNYIGEVNLSVNTIKGANSYMWQYQKSNATDGIWQSLPANKTHATISGLESAVEYSFKVAGVGAYPSLNYSKVVKCVVI